MMAKIVYDNITSITVKDPIEFVADPNAPVEQRISRIEEVLQIVVSVVTDLQNDMDTLESDETANRTGLKNKVDKNEDIAPGTYPMIVFDEKGLILKGKALAMKDLPAELIQAVQGLESELKKISYQLGNLQK